MEAGAVENATAKPVQKTGRPRKFAGTEPLRSTSIRLEPSLEMKLRQAAERNGRGIGAEIEDRLAQTFEALLVPLSQDLRARMEEYRTKRGRTLEEEVQRRLGRVYDADEVAELMQEQEFTNYVVRAIKHTIDANKLAAAEAEVRRARTSLTGAILEAEIDAAKIRRAKKAKSPDDPDYIPKEKMGWPRIVAKASKGAIIQRERSLEGALKTLRLVRLELGLPDLAGKELENSVR